MPESVLNTILMSQTLETRNDLFIIYQAQFNSTTIPFMKQRARGSDSRSEGIKLISEVIYE